MPRIIAQLVFVLLLSGIGSSSFGDVHITMLVEGDLMVGPAGASGEFACPAVSPIRPGVTIETWISDQHVRQDRPGMSLILRKDLGSLFVLFHQQKQLARFSYPLKLKQYQSEFAKNLGKEAKDFLEYRAKGEIADEVVRMEGREARKLSATVANGLGNEARLVLVTVAEAGVDFDRAWELERAWDQMRYDGYDGPLSALPALADVPWILEIWDKLPTSEALTRTKVTAIEHLPDQPERYEPPPGYSEIALDPFCLKGY